MNSITAIGLNSAESSSTDSMLIFASRSSVSLRTVAMQTAEKTSGADRTGKDARDAGQVLEKWLRANHGEVQDIGGPGSRTYIAELYQR